MTSSAADPRLGRRSGGYRDGESVAAATDGSFRDDLERIRFSPFFSRLAAVTQVISQTAAAQVIHNRLTHTIKVTAVARAIATRLLDGPHRAMLADLGGCDPVVVQAGASAHDLGHPPFGHLGERILDRIARSRFGLVDGFEGNAQTFRILTSLDVHGEHEYGLDLTAAVRAAVLKYPWARIGYPVDHPSAITPGPRGSGVGPDGGGSAKFSAYIVDVPELASVRAAYPALSPWQQTVECAVMDAADDIAYSLHDLDDFYRAGVLEHAAVSAEFRTWSTGQSRFAALGADELAAGDRRPGYALERLRRRLAEKDGWVADDELFAGAVARIGDEFVEGLLASPYDSSIAAERAIGRFTAGWIEHLQSSVTVVARPTVRSAHVILDPQAWHEVAVLKFIHQRFVLDRSDLALFQRGQARMLIKLVGDLESWLTDPTDAARAPRKLVDWVDLAIADYRALAASAPELLVSPTGDPMTSPDQLVRLGRGRGIIDYVASLTDDRAIATSAALAGRSGQVFTGGSGL